MNDILHVYPKTDFEAQELSIDLGICGKHFLRLLGGERVVFSNINLLGGHCGGMMC